MDVPTKERKAGGGHGEEGQDLKSVKGDGYMSYWQYICDQAWMSPEVLDWQYEGSGTEDDPYVVTWIKDDPRDPLGFSQANKWLITLLVAFVTLAAAFMSSTYSGCLLQITQDFHISEEVATLGLSLYVVGFAVGPMLWAPMSELYGRQIILFISYGALTAFNAGAAGAKNAATLLVLRFFAGACGASSLTNSGGVIADIFHAKDRGLAMALFAMAPFMGPTLGPLVGGFLGMARGWRWVEGLTAIFSGALWLLSAVLVPETYAPLLLRKRANRLSELTGKVYRSRFELQGQRTAKQEFKKALFRPWALAIHEPIVLFLSVWMSIIYGTLYMFFGAMPIVYQEQRGWNEGQGGLPFLAILAGIMVAILYSIPDDHRFRRRAEQNEGLAPPEQRLPPSIIGGFAVPISLFWFAWTNSPKIHYMASIAAAVPFGFGMVLIFISIKNYIADAYTLYAASALAVTVIMRSFFGAAFPLFTTAMFHNLGIHWASTLTAFLSLLCAPLPVICYVYGKQIRAKCLYAARSEAFVRKMNEESKAINAR